MTTTDTDLVLANMRGLPEAIVSTMGIQKGVLQSVVESVVDRYERDLYSKPPQGFRRDDGRRYTWNRTDRLINSVGYRADKSGGGTLFSVLGVVYAKAPHAFINERGWYQGGRRQRGSGVFGRAVRDITSDGTLLEKLAESIKDNSGRLVG